MERESTRGAIQPGLKILARYPQTGLGFSARFEEFWSVRKDDSNGRKTSFKNKHLRNGDHFVIIASSLHLLLLTEYDGKRLLKVSLKQI